MGDPVAMRLVERVGDLGRDFQCLVERQWPFLEARRQRLALEMRHDEVVSAIDAADVVDAADVGMVERSDGASLALEALLEFWIVGDVFGRTLIATVRSSRVSRACRPRPSRPLRSGQRFHTGRAACQKLTTRRAARIIRGLTCMEWISNERRTGEESILSRSILPGD